MMDQKQQAFNRMEQVFPAINRTYHEAEMKEDWLTNVPCTELAMHDLCRCWQFTERMQDELQHMVAKLQDLSAQLLAMQRAVLTGLFHTEDTVCEASKVA